MKRQMTHDEHTVHVGKTFRFQVLHPHCIRIEAAAGGLFTDAPTLLAARGKPARPAADTLTVYPQGLRAEAVYRFENPRPARPGRSLARRFRNRASPSRCRSGPGRCGCIRR